MALANVALTDTFDQWRVKTNQLIIYTDQVDAIAQQAANSVNSAVFTASNLAADIVFANSAFQNTINTFVGNVVNNYIATSDFPNVRNTANTAQTVSILSFNTANLAFIVANNASNTANVFAANAAGIIADTLASNTVFLDTVNSVAEILVSNYLSNTDVYAVLDQANLAFDQSNAAYNQSNTAYDQSNLAFSLAQTAFGQSNTANVNANAVYNLAISANNLSNAAFIAANSANTRVDGAYTLAQTAYDHGSDASVSANAYTRVFANSVGSAANAYALTIVTASNNYANSIGTSGNTYAVSIGTSANTFANTKLANTTGSVFGGNLIVAGTVRISQGGLIETRTTMAANDIDLSTGSYFTKTISGTTTLTVSNVPVTGNGASFILDLTNGGSATITWWSGVKWAGGTAPTLTTSGRDSLGFYTHDGGTTWTGLILGKDIK